MKKLKLVITESTDVNVAFDKLKENCLKKRISESETDQIIDKMRNDTLDFVKRGHDLVAIGSQFRMNRAYSSGNVEILLDLDFGGRSSSLGSKIRSIFKKQ
jgi:hypothetical protein